MVWCSSGDLSKFCRNLIACQHGWLLLEGISTWQGSCLRAADLHHSQAAWNDMKTGAVRCQDPARSFAGVMCAYPRSPRAAKVWEESIWPRIILSTALVLNPTWCYHTHIPGLGWDWALTSWIEQKWRLEGEMKLCGSRNRGKSWGPRLEEAWRAGIQAGRLRPEQDTKAGDRRGENGRQQSQAEAVVALWWSPTCWPPHSQLWSLLPGRTWVMWPHRMAQGLEATCLLWANHAGRQGFRKQNWSHPMQRGGMGKRMSLKPSLWWCSSSYLKAQEKIASCSDVCPVAAHRELLTLPPAKLTGTVPTSLGWWQELK